jgi:glycerol-3-phosphate dehydrogenase (NAD(P)+)
LSLQSRIKDNLRLLKTHLNDAVPITVVGGGSWATALVKIITENNVKVNWWLRDQNTIKHIRKYKHNPKYLSNVLINKRRVKVMSDLSKALEPSKYVIFAVPAAFVEGVVENLRPTHFENKYIISAIKGLIPVRNTLVTDYFYDVFQITHQSLAVIGGPCHAEEVASEKQSYLTIASTFEQTASDFAHLLSCRYISTHTSEDLYGIEYCAVLKNVIALACGIAHGLNYGDNFQAVLVSNAMLEIERFLQVIHPLSRNLLGSAYLGDLLVTAYSQFSRNRTFGNMIGRGYTVQSAQVEMNMIAEGYFAIKGIEAINQKYGVDMPICQAVYNILYNHTNPASEIQYLKSKLS